MRWNTAFLPPARCIRSLRSTEEAVCGGCCPGAGGTGGPLLELRPQPRCSRREAWLFALWGAPSHASAQRFSNFLLGEILTQNPSIEGKALLSFSFVSSQILPFHGGGQSLGCVQRFAIPRTAAHQAPLSFTVSWSSLKLMSIESMMPSSHRILSRPLLLLPSIFPNISIFSSESALHIRWPKGWSFIQLQHQSFQ